MLGVAAVGVALPFVIPDYRAQIAMLWALVIMAQTWDITGGQTGYNSFGNILFFGVGMYASVVVQRDAGLDYFPGLVLGMVTGAGIAAALAVLLGSMILRMRGHYFAIATLGLGIAAGEIAGGWDYVGAGSGLSPPLFPAPPGTANLFFAYLYFGLAALVFAALAALYRTRFGLALNAIRDNEDKAEAMGLHTGIYKVTAWTMAAFVLGLVGGRHGQHAGLRRPARYRLRRRHLRRLDGADGDPGRQGDALGPGARRHHLPHHAGAALDPPARLAARGARRHHRRHRGVLPARDPRLGADALARAPRAPGARERARMSAQLTIDGATKRFGGVTANEDISLEVPEGRVVGLIGPNGSGKSTLFNSIVGYHPVDGGSIRFEGREITRLRTAEIARLGLIRTFQQTHVFVQMTGLQNMAISDAEAGHGLFRLMRPVSAETRERAEALLAFCGLYGKRHLMAGELSFGQRKLLELAMALMVRPRMLLLDEPTAGINPTLINGVIERLQRANREFGVTLFVIEHNMRVIMSLAEHIHCLAHGKLLASGPPEELRNDRRVIDAYLGAR